MFARIVQFNVKANAKTEIARTLENQILPLLQRQSGFRDLITCTATEGKEVTAISFWDRKEDADAYNRKSYPDVLRALEKVMDGTAHVQQCDVSLSTPHKIGVRAAGA